MAKSTNNHRKAYINSDGKHVMRITEIIKVLAKDQLILWANMIGLKGIKYREELDRTANIGTMAHGVIEQITNGEDFVVLDYDDYKVYGFESQREARHALQSFFSWYDKNRHWYKVIFTERVVVGKRFGGTIDCGIEGIKDPKKVIFVDYKTSKDFFFTMFLQLAGYVDLYEEVNGPDTVEGVMVILMDKKEGKQAKTCFLPRENMDMLITCFECLYNTALTTRMMESMWRKLCIRNIEGGLDDA